MHILILNFLKRLHWKIPPDAPALFALEHHTGIHLLNPLIFPSLEKNQAAKRTSPTGMACGFVDDCVFLQTEGLALALSDEVAELYEPGDRSVLSQLLVKDLPLFGVAEQLLLVLRYFSKQVDTPLRSDQLKFWDWLEIDDLPDRQLPERSELLRAVQRRLVDTAITVPHIHAACSAEPNFQPPLYDALYLDAILAFHDYDYRKSILYSAMAAEAAAATILDEFYERYVIGADEPRWRSVRIPVRGGQFVQQDPIWESLRSRSGFPKLLHECPLYLFGRSMEVEDEALYRDLRQLYSTRNKIAHGDEPPSVDDKFLSLDAQGASRALISAQRMLAWFGVTEEYRLPSPGMVQLTDRPGTSEQPSEPSE